MIKQTFLDLLSERLLSVTPERIAPSDAVRTLDYYKHKIESSVEDGMPEEEAVAAVGHPDEVFRSVLEQFSPVRENESASEKERTASDRTEDGRSAGKSPWRTVLLILTSPIWIPLLIAAAAIVFSLFVALWSLVISVWAVFVSLLASGAVVLASSVPMFFSGTMAEAFAAVGMGTAAVGAGLLFLVFSLIATRLAARLTACTFRGIISLFFRKERVS
jgi:uncharacterized membrane protein